MLLAAASRFSTPSQMAKPGLSSYYDELASSRRDVRDVCTPRGTESTTAAARTQAPITLLFFTWENLLF